jgi:transposase, IS5 family
MNGSAELFGLAEHLERLSKHGDPLEARATVDFEHFRGWLVEGLGYGDGAKGGRPPFDPVSMFKALILQAQHNLSDARMEFMIRDRLSWMRFLGFDLGAPTPDENTIRHFRNRLTETGTLKRVMKAFDWQLRKKGYIPMAGQIVDASLVPAPKQRNTEGREGSDQGGQVGQGDLAGRAEQGGAEGHARALDAEGRRQGPIPSGRRPAADDRGAGLRLQVPHQHRPALRLHPRERGDIGLGMRTDGMLKRLVRPEEHRLGGLGRQRLPQQKNEKWLAERMLTSRIHRRKPAGKPMPQATARRTRRSPRSAPRSSMSSYSQRCPTQPRSSVNARADVIRATS